MHLSFLNANWTRKYPFCAAANLSSDAGITMPNDLIVGCRLMVDAAHLDVVISKVYVKDSVVSIEFAVGSSTREHTPVLGTASGKITQDNQTLVIKPTIPTFSGFVVIGNKEQAAVDQHYIFNWSNGALEPSVVSAFVAPKISALVHNGQKLTGKVGISVDQLIMTTAGNTINLAVLAPTSVASRADRTSALLTCNNPIISGINSVTPNSVNNIDIYGIAPVKVEANSGRITLTTDKSVPDVCKPVNIPPQDSDDTYHGNITTADAPEWKSWPQFESNNNTVT